MKKQIIAFFGTALLLLSAMAQIPDTERGQAIPQVALIGQYESAFEMLTSEHPGILLSVCGNNMDLAFEKWVEMLLDMEEYARSIDYDINGLKTYLYIFWNADGTIRHLAFYPKVNSRNIPNAELVAFFKGFAGMYKMPLLSPIGYSHYGSAAFPTHARPMYKVKRD